MAGRDNKTFEIPCPCCGAKLTVDAHLGKVIDHEAPPKQSNAPDLSDVSLLLEKERARREAIFQQSTEDQKTQSELLERKFEESLKKAKDQPVTRPVRDFDLD